MSERAVIFDMDGVLADTEPLHLAALRDLMRGYGVELGPDEADEFFGSTDERMFGILRERYGLKPDAKSLAREREGAMLDRFEGLKPRPGAAALLDGLREQGVPLALASSSSRDVVDATLGALNFASYFHEIVSGDQAARSKPAPDIFLEAARRLNVAPARCVAIEDSRNGTLAAKAAGMACLAVPCPATANQDLSAADRIVESLERLTTEELLDLIAERLPVE